MNGRQAKRLRKLVASYFETSVGEGRNTYKRVKNRVQMQPIKDESGKTVLDPEGKALLKPTGTPGTIYTGWKFRAMYQQAKKLWRKDFAAKKLIMEEMKNRRI